MNKFYSIYYLLLLFVYSLASCEGSTNESIELGSIPLKGMKFSSVQEETIEQQGILETEQEMFEIENVKNPLFLFTKELKFKDFPKSHNPSLIQSDLGLILTFRYCPDLLKPWMSYTGIVILNDQLEPISQPQLINTRPTYSLTSSQTEDARIFSFQGDLYLTYNDNMENMNPNGLERRDIFIAPLHYIEGEFKIDKPIKLYHQKDYFSRMWQKNWTPFEWNGHLLISYSFNPHEVLYPNLVTGECISLYKTSIAPLWLFGEMRGGTPALLIDGEYLGFFHSSVVMESCVSNKQKIHHYFMGAYTFSAEPPFNITRITPTPLLDKNFYTQSEYEKRVIFPAGFIVSGPHIYLAYGKDDQEIWITKINKKALYSLLIPVDTE